MSPSLRTSPLSPHSVRFALRLALVVVLAPCLASAATLHGTVTDPDGRPVPGARVLLTTRLGVAASGVSDARGEYRIGSLDAGRYDLHVVLDGFRNPPLAVDLAADDVRELPVALVLSAVSESLVVSAAPIEVPMSRTADTVTVITRADLESRQVESVSDALRGVPGLSVNRSGGRGALTSLFPRGGESDFTLVLVDGMRANAFGGGFDFSQLPVASIDRVEVVRGPQSALFGSDAIGGVVHIVTRHGGPIEGTGTVEGGGLGTFRFAGSTSGSQSAWSWGAAFERLTTDGYTGTAPGSGEPVGNDDYQRREGSGSLAWRSAGGADLRFDGRLFADERGFPGPYGSNPIGVFPGVDRISRGSNDGNQIGVRFIKSLTSSERIRQRASVMYADFDGTFVSPFGESTSESRRLSMRAQTDILAWRDATASVGIEYQRERAASTFITGESGSTVPVRRQVIGYFGEVRSQHGERLGLSAGVRVEQIRRESLEASLDPFSPRPPFDTDTVISANPKATVTYLLNASGVHGSFTRLHASAGTGIRPPDAFEIAFTDNPDLKPERSKSVDAGVTQGLAQGALVLEATGFFNHYDDLIVAVGRSQQDASRFRTDNISNASARGLELGVTGRTPWGFSARVSYTWLDTEILAVDGTSNEAPSPFSPGDPLIRRPRHQAALDLTVTRARWNAFATLNARGDVRDIEPNFGAFGGLFDNPGYAAVHLGGGVRLIRQLDVYARVMNVFDRQYEESLGFPAIGRTALVGVRIAASR